MFSLRSISPLLQHARKKLSLQHATILLRKKRRIHFIMKTTMPTPRQMLSHRYNFLLVILEYAVRLQSMFHNMCRFRVSDVATRVWLTLLLLDDGNIQFIQSCHSERTCVFQNLKNTKIVAFAISKRFTCVRAALCFCCQLNFTATPLRQV